MKNQLFEDLIESIKELPTEILEEMRMNMNEEQMRKDFEEWAASKGFNTKLREDTSSSDTFFAYETEQRWVCWQASRESLVVELPISEIYDSRSGSLNEVEEVIYPEDIQQVLESQGIKWK